MTNSTAPVVGSPAPLGHQPAPPAAGRLPREERSFIARYSLLILLLITAFAAYIRIAWIDYPAIWNDDAHTFRRVSGSYQDLLDILQSDGFAPLIFEMYWWIGHLLGNPAKLDPFWLRIVPSIAGTLMVPAMYFLARQLLSKRTSLLAAAFAATSAYLMVYARDARMYMPLWLCCTLSIACILWWLRTGLRVAWLAWVASSLACGGIHAPGLMLMGLYPIFMLTQRGVSSGPGRFLSGATRRLILFIIGMAIIASGPLVHYKFFNRMKDRVDSSNWDRASGLAWAHGVLDGRDGKDRLRFVSSAFLYSWEWPADSYEEQAQPRMQKDRPAETAPLPRRGLRRGGAPEPAAPRGAQDPGAQKIISEVGLAPQETRLLAKAAGPSATPRPISRDGMFSYMLKGYNIDPRIYTGLGAAVILAAVFAFIGMFPWSRKLRGQKLADPPTEPFWRSTLYILAWLVVPTYGFYCMAMKDFASPSDWLYSARAVFAGQWWIILIGIVIVSLVMLAWRRIPTFLVMFATLVVIALLGWAAVRSQLWTIFAKTGSWWKPTSYHLAEQWWMAPRLFGDSCAAVFSRPMVLLAGAILLPALAWHYSAPTIGQRAIRFLQLSLTLGVIYGLCALVCWALRKWPPMIDSLVWIPRYIAVIWPAVALAICAMIMRLPTRPLRWFAIAMLLGVNFTQAYGRMFLGSEPRVDLMARDVVDCDKSDGSLRTYIANGPDTAHPSGGTVDNRPGKYYINVLTGIAFRPHDFLSIPSTRALKNQTIYRYASAARVAADARSSPRLMHIIVWDRLYERPKADAADDVLAALGPAWERTSESFYPVRYHWNWSDLYISRRRDYVRMSVPSTPPAAAPAPRTAPPQTRAAPTARPEPQSTTRPAPSPRPRNPRRGAAGPLPNPPGAGTR